jgi:hypothetical protein
VRFDYLFGYGKAESRGPVVKSFGLPLRMLFEDDVAKLERYSAPRIGN